MTLRTALRIIAADKVRLVVALSALAILATAVVTLGSWTVGSSAGNGYSKAVTAQNVTLSDASASTTAQLYPGGTGDLVVKVTNPNAFGVTVTAVTGAGHDHVGQGRSLQRVHRCDVHQHDRSHAVGRGRDDGDVLARRQGRDVERIGQQLSGRCLHGPGHADCHQLGASSPRPRRPRCGARDQQRRRGLLGDGGCRQRLLEGVGDPGGDRAGTFDRHVPERHAQLAGGDGRWSCHLLHRSPLFGGRRSAVDRRELRRDAGDERAASRAPYRSVAGSTRPRRGRRTGAGPRVRSRAPSRSRPRRRASRARTATCTGRRPTSTRRIRLPFSCARPSRPLRSSPTRPSSR